MTTQFARPTRRALLAAAAAIPTTLAQLPLAALPRFGRAQADAPMGGLRRPFANRVRLGEMEIITLSDGAVLRDGPHPAFGGDQPAETVAALLAENFLPADRYETGFTPTIVNTGADVVLFDAGNGVGRRAGAGLLVERLAAVDLTPEQIDIVALTHFHPDHIGGLIADGAPVYPNARYVAAAAEFDFWMAEARLSGRTDRVARLTRAQVAPLAERMEMIGDGARVASGVTAVASPGHTPGHTAYHVESAGRRLMITGDAANHYVIALQRPDWPFRFDVDAAAASATRRALFGMIAADRIPFAGYHMPYPSIGYVEPFGDGFRYAPASYQLHL